MVKSIIEGTITLIIIYLVLSNGKSFAAITQAGASAYVGGVKALQGR